MSDKTTRTDEQMRIIYIGAPEELAKPWQSRRGTDFDRWLAAHDAAIRADGKREGLEEAAEIARAFHAFGEAPKVIRGQIASAIRARVEGEEKA